MKRLRRTRHRGVVSGAGAGAESGGAHIDRSFADEDREEGDESDDDEDDEDNDDEDHEDEEEDDDDEDLAISLDVDRNRLLESTFEALNDVNVRTLVRGRLDVVFEVSRRQYLTPYYTS